MCVRGIPFFFLILLFFSSSSPWDGRRAYLGSLFVMEAWNREGVFYILLWLCILSYYTFYRVFGGRDEGGLDEEMTGIDVYVT